jgi:hypothetical protein
MKFPDQVVFEARATRIDGSGQAAPFPPVLPEFCTRSIATGTLAIFRFYQFPSTSNEMVSRYPVISAANEALTGC